ncbi:4-coumarate--CoA ligase 2 [Platanthera zijinensis]|uniref:4-coumarate--CoA ligase 2 n=1 Tax=Platanthera zijinensis TaxID=2320716 RepID=A0AAP0BRA3_9ASPA
MGSYASDIIFRSRLADISIPNHLPLHTYLFDNLTTVGPDHPCLIDATTGSVLTYSDVRLSGDDGGTAFVTHDGTKTDEALQGICGDFAVIDDTRRAGGSCLNGPHSRADRRRCRRGLARSCCARVSMPLVQSERSCSLQAALRLLQVKTPDRVALLPRFRSQRDDDPLQLKTPERIPYLLRLTSTSQCL